MSKTMNDSLNNYSSSQSHASPRLGKGASILWSVIIFVVGVALVVAYFYFDRNDWISSAIRNTGPWGIGIAIVLMALFCVIPVPSEFLMVMNMKVFGVWWGIFYTWIGAMLGALAVFFVARHLGHRLLDAFVSHDRFAQVNKWVAHKGAVGLLLARLVPLPFIVVNYVAGVLKSVRPWDYVWTTGVGLLPYDLGAALVFLGFSRRFTLWLVIGGLVVVGIWTAGFLYNRQVQRTKRWAH